MEAIFFESQIIIMEDTFIDDLFKEYELPPNWLADCQGCDRTAPLKQQPFAKWLAPHFGNDDDLFIFTVYDSDGKAHVLINPYNPLEPEQEVVPGIEEKEAEKVQEVQEKVAENVEGHSQTEGKLTEEGLEHPAQQDPNKENEKEPSTDENRASFPARNDTLEDDSDLEGGTSDVISSIQLPEEDGQAEEDQPGQSGNGCNFFYASKFTKQM